MRSMTGFGRGVAEHGGLRATVDLRSVNHRFLDLKLRGQIAPALEDQVATRIRARVARGSIAVAIHVARPPGTSGIRIDEAAARRAYEALHALAETLGVAPPDLALVLAQPGVVASGDAVDHATGEPDPGDAAILAALDQGLGQLQAMRDAEGRALEREVRAQLDELARLRAAIASQAVGGAEQVAEKLRERIGRLAGDAGVDPARLAQEIAVIAERADITEELVRLASHLDQANSIARGTAASGRKLEFLVQEIGREINTIGSKAQRTEITAGVVEAKAVLEKMREQIQNVE